MEVVLIVAVGVGLVTFGLMMLAFLVGGGLGKARLHKQEAAFEAYVAEHFPEVPTPPVLLVAERQSRGKRDTALLVAEPRGEIILLFGGGPQGVTHLAYPTSALTGVGSTSRIISRGLPTSRIYSYEQTMTVEFNDGRSFPFILENITNSSGTDDSPTVVAAMFAPWEEKLRGILGPTAPAASPPVPPARPVPPVPPVPPVQRPSATWYPDPTSRHQLRYWDGRTWTDYVVDQGTQGVDPLQAA